MNPDSHLPEGAPPGVSDQESPVSRALGELAAALVRPDTSVEEVATLILDRAKALSGSRHGVVAAADPHTGDMIGHTLTGMMQDCHMEQIQSVFPRREDGTYGSLWGHCLNTREAFFTNSPSSHIGAEGLPEGHIQISTFLAAPAYIGSTVLGLIALANAPDGYTERDVAVVRRLARLYALFLERKNSERVIAALARFPEENPNPVLRILADGTISYANAASEMLLDAWDCRCGDTLPPPWAAVVEDALHSGKAAHAEVEHAGGICALVFAPVCDFGYVNVYGMDVTDQRRAENVIRLERDFTSTILDTSAALVVVMDAECRIERINNACEDGVGCTLADVRGVHFWDVFAMPQSTDEVRQAFRNLSAREPGRYEGFWRAPDGTLRLGLWSISAITGADGAVEHYISTGLDVTEHRQYESYHLLNTRLLEELNRPDRGKETLAIITGLIRSTTGFEAVGLRLKKGQDFPYYLTEGFPARFVEAERHLCKLGFDGKPARGADGQVVLECICGAILTGGTDAAMPFYTDAGSFWTNSASLLAAEYTAEQLGAEVRGTCIQTGYESIALVPIKAEGEVVGLMQLNDSRPGRFTPTTIQFLEQICASIGMALKRQRAEETLRELNETLEQKVAKRTAALERRAAQLRLLNSELSNVEQRERKRLSGILHDHVQQMLVAAKLKVSLIGRRGMEGSAEAIREIEDLLQDSIDSCRSLAVELSPPVLREDGLAAALEWLAGQMKGSHDLYLTVQIDAEAAQPDEATAILLYHAVRELLLNVIKHAEATEAHVRLARDTRGICIEVSDDGVGFDQQHLQAGIAHSGLGLFSIWERMEAAGGSMKIQSMPGSGTCITLKAPLAHRRGALKSGYHPR